MNAVAADVLLGIGNDQRIQIVYGNAQLRHLCRRSRIVSCDIGVPFILAYGQMYLHIARIGIDKGIEGVEAVVKSAVSGNGVCEDNVLRVALHLDSQAAHILCVLTDLSEDLAVSGAAVQIPDSRIEAMTV